MNNSLPETATPSLGKLTLALSLGGASLAALIGFVARMLERDASFAAYLLFATCQIAAVVVGWRSRREPSVRAGIITAVALLALSILFF